MARLYGCAAGGGRRELTEGGVDSIRGQVRSFIAEDLGRDVRSVSDAESLLEAGILDSMGVMSLVGFIEERFKVTVPDDEMMPENFDSIEAIAAFVERRRSNG